MIELSPEAHDILVNALRTEIEFQRREQKRVRFNGHAYLGRESVIRACESLIDEFQSDLDIS